MLQYAIHPDFVESRNGGQVHYIGALQLARLYRLEPSQYVVIDDSLDRHQYARAMRRAEELDLVHLFPRYDGNYTLPS